MPKEKKLFQMAVSSRNNSGFTLVEILLYISFYGLVMALLIPCAEGIIKVDNRLEMEGFCQRLAAEVTALQQAALWGAGLQNKLTVDLDQQCYYVYREGKIVKKVRLQEIGQGYKLIFIIQSLPTSRNVTKNGVKYRYLLRKLFMLRS